MSASRSSAATPWCCAPTSCSSAAASRSATRRGCSRATRDAIVIRSGSHESVAELAAGAAVPVVNALTPLHHPCQALADLLTLQERFGELDGLQRRLRRRRQQRRPLACDPRPQPPGSKYASRRPRVTSSRRATAAVADAGSPRGGVGRRRALRGRLGQHGRRGRGREAPRRPRPVPAQRGPARASHPTARSRCTACPRTRARRSARRPCTASARQSGTRRRTACMRRRRCSSCCSEPPGLAPAAAPWCNGQHIRFSFWERGFDSRRGYSLAIGLGSSA